MKKYKGKRFKESNTNPLTYIFLIICVATMIFSGVKICIWFSENQKSNAIINEIQYSVSIDNNIDSVEKYTIDFESLKNRNPDTIAWIKVNGTSIEYPIVKTSNNDFYMNHSFDKSYNSAGWVFMDYKNSGDGTDKNMVIYAHNRLDNSLFGTLKNILSSDWYDNIDNLTIPLIFENEKAEYQLFSVYKIAKEDYYITTNFNSDSDFEQFINTIKSRSIKDFGVDVTTEDSILTLSTCAETSSHRVVLHAIKK